MHKNFNKAIFGVTLIATAFVANRVYEHQKLDKKNVSCISAASKAYRMAEQWNAGTNTADLLIWQKIIEADKSDFEANVLKRAATILHHSRSEIDPDEFKNRIFSFCQYAF